MPNILSSLFQDIFSGGTESAKSHSTEDIMRLIRQLNYQAM